MTNDEHPNRSLSRAQVEALLTGFEAAEWQRLSNIAGSLAFGLTGWTGEDLQQEAITKLLDGSRRWPDGVPALVVLKTVMRSIAANARKHAATGPVDEYVVANVATEWESDATLAVHGVTTVTPEDIVSGKQQIVAVYAAVAGDGDLELLVMAWADGLRGDDARSVLGWDPKKYDAERKRLIRRLGVLDPDRRPK